ncbi:L-threonine 3-dehydrogenase [Actinoplanes sp. SE50]|uniref:zinc-binding dehydrogenase n=1 Tax=unclassified Actinoplanes TaxID=2626549 RepID=UPI00023ECBB8|nr:MULTISPECIES: zinc-binding dehydrogenase [unclassified Actinoplanes]AEV87136.1 L-threonine 3-dehydrogenase [Actinoplanes sp. SE50/110]ATO85534.1 L-threonine 3-dehydrogenase [Actinoplanes sp. SE50]SLM02947.1 hypothetical protein ACSP50_6232 [Actinoplanes sp. SE50/110]
MTGDGRHENAALVRENGGLTLRFAGSCNPEAIQILRAGVCGTDLQILRNARPDAARILGHEGLGILPDERRYVLFNPVDPDDQDRILGHSYDGIHQRYLDAPGRPPLVSAAPNLPADLAVLVEPLAAVLYGWELAAPRSSVGIWGAGTTGVLVALVAEIRGVRAHLIHRRTDRLAFLRSTVQLLSTQTSTKLDQRRAARLDGAFICLPREGAHGALADALDAVGDNATIDLLGGFGTNDRHPDLPGVDLGQIRRSNVCGSPVLGAVTPARTRGGKQVSLTGHRGTSAAHMAEAQDLLIEHAERFGALITHVLALDVAGLEVERMARGGTRPSGRAEYIKVAIDPTMPDGSRRRPDWTTTIEDLK